MSKITIEDVARIFDDTTGYYFEVGPDSDGLELICIRWGDNIKEPDGECPAMDGDQARALGEALIRVANAYIEREPPK